MISLSHLNKFKLLLVFFVALIFSSVFAEEEAIDIWQDKENQSEQNTQINNKKDITVESSILSDDVNKIVIKVEETRIGDQDRSVIGIFDPEENNFNLHMWAQTDGEDIKKILKRIDKLNLSKLSEDLLFKVLFTNAYQPRVNLSMEEFLKIKINWLIKQKRIEDLEIFLKKTEFNYVHAPVDINFMYNFDISVYPTHWIVDETGVIRDLIVGTSLNIYNQLSSLIEKNKK